MRFVLLVHEASQEATSSARDACKWLEDCGHSVDTVVHRNSSIEESARESISEADLVVSLGGDGTMLRAVETASPWAVPVLGVNLGTLGYLTEIEPANLRSSLERFLSGDFQIETRTTLEVANKGGEIVFPAALNEAVLERTLPGHTVRICVWIDGVRFASYAADGLLVSSATGSTAYNLSVRGPILSPALDAVVLSPISPHMLFDRALVLGPEETVDLEVLGPLPAVLVVDGVRLGEIQPGHGVSVRRSPHPARLVTFTARDVHGILRAKFHLSDR
jgi:NAD+ kinase